MPWWICYRATICSLKPVREAPFNVAIGVARLGHDSGFIGRVGNDTFGRFLHQTLVTAQVDTGSLEFDAQQHTSTVLVSLAPNGERQFEFLVNPSADQFQPGESARLWCRYSALLLAGAGCP